MRKASAWFFLTLLTALAILVPVIAVVSRIGFLAWGQAGAGYRAAEDVCLSVFTVGRSVEAYLALALGGSALLGTVGAGAVAAAVSLMRERRLGRALGGRSPATGVAPWLDEVLTEVGLAGRVCVVSSESLFAFTRGVLRPTVIISSGLLSQLTPEEIRAVLAHEAYHVRQRDPLRTLVVLALSRALFFVPLLQGLASAYRVEKEIEADRWALGHASASALAAAMLKMVGAPENVPHPLPLVPFSGPRARIRHLIAGERVGYWPVTPGSLLSTASALILVGVGLSWALSLAETPHVLHICPL